MTSVLDAIGKTPLVKLQTMRAFGADLTLVASTGGQITGEAEWGGREEDAGHKRITAVQS